MLRKKRKSYLILLTIEIFCLVLLLAGCFQKDEQVECFFGKDIQEMTVEAEDHLKFSGDSFLLAPGVYQVRVQTSLAKEQSMYVELKCEDSYFNTLHSNGVAVLPGNDYMDFYVYVLDKIPTAYMECQFYGGGPETLVMLDVSRTCIGNRILLFIVLLVFGTVDCLIEFRRRILEGRISRKKQVVFWTLAAGVMLAYFPYLSDYFYLGEDTAFHLSRIAGLADSIVQGCAFPVRIQSGWLYNHGYAVSMFYGDLFLLFPAGLMLMGFSIMAAYKIFLFVVLAVMAFIAYHSFYQCVKEEYAALFGSMVYLLSPYHIHNIYNRGALGEILAMTFLPLVCCGMYLLYTKNVEDTDYKKYKWYIVLGMSAVLQSHLISTEMTAVMMALFCLVFFKKTFRKETFLQLLEATGIVLLINMWFWLPLIYMMNCDGYRLQEITHRAVQEQGIYLANILQMLPNAGGGTQKGMVDCEPLHIGAGALMLLCIYVLWSVRRRKWDRACTISAGFSVLTLLMSTGYLPWDDIMNIPGVGYIVSSLEFPWRWMVWATMFVSLFAAFFFLRVKEDNELLSKVVFGIAAMLAAGSAIYCVNNISYTLEGAYLYAVESMGTTDVANGEYLLEEAGNILQDMYYHEPVAEEGLYWSDFEQKGTNVTLTLENTAEETRCLEVPLMGYKGYGIRTTDTQAFSAKETPYIAEEVGTHGDLRIAVPAGYAGNVRISYQGFPMFHVAEAVSIASSAAVLAGYFYLRRRQDG